MWDERASEPPPPRPGLCWRFRRVALTLSAGAPTPSGPVRTPERPRSAQHPPRPPWPPRDSGTDSGLRPVARVLLRGALSPLAVPSRPAVPAGLSPPSALGRASLPQGLGACRFRRQELVPWVPAPRAAPCHAVPAQGCQPSPHCLRTPFRPPSLPFCLFSLRTVLPEMHINLFQDVLSASSTRVVF